MPVCEATGARPDPGRAPHPFREFPDKRLYLMVRRSPPEVNLEDFLVNACEVNDFAY